MGRRALARRVARVGLHGHVNQRMGLGPAVGVRQVSASNRGAGMDPPPRDPRAQGTVFRPRARPGQPARGPRRPFKFIP